MGFSIQDMQAFVTIQETRSFSAAAEKLLVTSPALTRRIKKLEDFVGDSVFDRSTHRVELTPTGTALLARATKMLREYEDFKQFAATVARENEVEVRLSSIMSVAGAVIPAAIRSYSVHNPRAQFVIHDCNGNDALQLVEEEQVEFAVSTQPPPELSLEFIKLCSDPIVLACPPGHELYEATSVCWRDLWQKKVMLIEGASSTFALIAQRLHEVRVPVPSGTRVQQLSTQIGFIEQGNCASVLPALSASLIQNSKVRIVHISEPAVCREIGIVTKTGRPISRSSSSFIEYFKGQFSALYVPLIDRMNWVGS